MAFWHGCLIGAVLVSGYCDGPVSPVVSRSIERVGGTGSSPGFPGRGGRGRVSSGPADGHAVVCGRRADTELTAEPQTRTADSAVKLVSTSWICATGT